jgi:hypothetical protein
MRPGSPARVQDGGRSLACELQLGDRCHKTATFLLICSRHRLPAAPLEVGRHRGGRSPPASSSSVSTPAVASRPPPSFSSAPTAVVFFPGGGRRQRGKLSNGSTGGARRRRLSLAARCCKTAASGQSLRRGVGVELEDRECGVDAGSRSGLERGGPCREIRPPPVGLTLRLHGRDSFCVCVILVLAFKWSGGRQLNFRD